ncbi:hypothetical protein TVAG_047470 [Trichomonas vaginalis G3]|uniref:DOCKER Lobe A domain-containing protein n=1 Tax=Trichomonas vaginalis (strain ATCC PRA-98 / G3) TaxID=412133 RepID=A2G9Z9_TRIV3|nr:dedicator of cytokinesis DOCK family [Trichomonas vaginalis G3]EAX86023.1 hypothetical protein TVAG_047470 [Trichomonas vaginalis G3]KAI5494490.1 dedicator of cytokinesis DOCK family [Trichomonas vaginalis G3]|eukprot:XP_001298953.1 hypothetical protein [Trichomonas vaginalis G3]
MIPARFKEQKNRRQTLEGSNMLMSSSIRAVPISNQSRFMFLTDKELDELSWLKPIARGTTHSYIAPKDIHPNQALALNRVSENLLTEKQPDDTAPLTVQKFEKDLEFTSYEAKYVSIPIIDSKYEQIIARKRYKFSDNYETIKLLHITKYEIVGKTGVGSSAFIELFSYLDFPTSETVRIDFCRGTPEACTFKCDHKDFYLPYIDDPKSRIVAVLSYVEKADRDPIEKPIAIGHKYISEIKCGQFNLEWVVFSPALSMDMYFKSDKKYPMFNLVFSFDLETKLPEDKRPVRITAFQPMYPTTLLTIHNIRLCPTHDIVQKGLQLYVNFMIRTHEESPKVLNTAARANMLSEISSFNTSTLNPSDIMNFPCMCNFKLNSSYEHSIPLEIYVEVHAVDLGKTKVIAECVVPISEPVYTGTFKLKGSSIFSGSAGSISFSYHFPTIVAPPKKLILSLISPPKKSIAESCSGSGIRPSGSLTKVNSVDLEQAAGPDYKHPMWQDVAKYMIQYCFDPIVMPQVDFTLLAERLENCDQSWLYKWIEHAFTCPDTFSAAYLKLLKDKIMDIGAIPLPFFLIALKGMISNRQFFPDEIEELLIATAHSQVPLNIKKAAGEFIRQLRMGFAPAVVIKLARKFIFALNTKERLCIFRILFSDPPFIMAIFTLTKPLLENINVSPYIPILSLFYATVRDTFLANSLKEIEPALKAIGLLGVSIEAYSDSSTSKTIAMYFFPLFTLIFTFADSLAPHLGTDPVLVPFILHICKNVKSVQFMKYFNILSDDNKLRFFDYFVSLSEETIIEKLSERAVVNNDSQLRSRLDSVKLTISLEVTCRMLVFLHFIEKINTLSNPRQILSILKIIIHMLSPTQDSEAFPIVFTSLAFVVNKFAKAIFIDKTNHILTILCSVVSCTQRKVAMARITAMAFLKWIVNLELVVDKSKKRALRCFIGFIFACVKSLFENPDFEFKATDISKDFRIINEMIPSLKYAWKESLIYFKNVENLKHNFTYVENVQGAMYLVVKQMEKINEENGDFLAAFLCQWRICAMIANVFKLRDQVVDGIPLSGSEDFPFLYDNYESKTNFSILQDTAYLLLEGDMFTEQSFFQEMQKAMELCQKANLNWIIGQITEHHLKYLENHRMFDTLVEVYMKIANSYGALYNDLEKGNQQKHFFYLVCFRGQIRTDLKRKNTIQILPKGGEKDFKDMITKAYLDIIWCSEDPLFIEDEKKIIFEKNKSYIQMIPVDADKIDMENLKVCNFTLDVLKEEKDWDDVYVIRHQFITGKKGLKANEFTNTYLPGMVSNAEIGVHTTTQITRKQYYMMYLNEYYEEITSQVEEFRAVMPPKKLEHMWTKWSLWLNTKLLMRLISKTLEENPSSAPLAFVKMYKTRIDHKEDDKLFNMKKEDMEKLIKLINNVWDSLYNATQVLTDLTNLNNRDRVGSGNETADKVLESYNMILTPSYAYLQSAL